VYKRVAGRNGEEGTRREMKRRVSPDEELMTALYTEHYAVLLSFISRYVRDRHKAEDLVQETLLRAWKHIDHLVEGWLVAEALERLSEEHQAVVRAMYYEGKSVADAARKLAVPEGTIKSRAYYAVRALRTAFEEMGVLR
jgi:RNA polymerase sigma-70 factor (ECF subfamily)